jgi:ankyrin repeat protein
LQIVSELLGRGANPNQKGPEGTTALHKGAMTAYADEHTLRLLDLLVGAKADVNARDDRGATALMDAARAKRAPVAIPLGPRRRLVPAGLCGTDGLGHRESG